MSLIPEVFTYPDIHNNLLYVVDVLPLYYELKQKVHQNMSFVLTNFLLHYQYMALRIMIVHINKAECQSFFT